MKSPITACISTSMVLHPFGMITVGRSWAVGNEYRYGFNNVEKENEILGSGFYYSFKYRIYDARIGKFLSIDPLYGTYPFYTPYQFAADNPIISCDLEGLENPNDKNPTTLPTPDGGEITLPAGTEIITFDEICQDIFFQNGDEFGVVVDPGSVRGFILPDGSVYDARWDKNGKFTGYAQENNYGDVIFNTPTLSYNNSQIVTSKYVYNRENKGGSYTMAGGNTTVIVGEIGLSAAGAATLGTVTVVIIVVDVMSNTSLQVTIQNFDMKSPAIVNASRRRVETKTKLEEAENQLDGILQNQNVKKKQAPQGQKQNAISSTKKSEQNLQNQLDRLRNLKDLENNY